MMNILAIISFILILSLLIGFFCWLIYDCGKIIDDCDEIIKDCKKISEENIKIAKGENL